MDISLEDFRRHYSMLADAALLAVPREDLTEMAKLCYDQELANRGLKRPAPPAASPGLVQVGLNPPSPNQQLVLIASYLDAHDARFATELLESAGIPSLTSNRPSEIQLLVAADLESEARQVLDSEISEDELAAQAEAAAHPDEDLT